MFVLPGVRVEWRIFGVWETIECALRSCLTCLLSASQPSGSARDIPIWTEPLMLLAWTLEYALPNAIFDVVEVMVLP